MKYDFKPNISLLQKGFLQRHMYVCVTDYARVRHKKVLKEKNYHFYSASNLEEQAR